MKIDLKYNRNQRPRNKLKQIGSSVSIVGYHKPSLKQLQIYEYTARYESVYQQAVQIMIDALIGALGELEHPDEDIQNFCRYSLERHKDLYAVDVFNKIEEIIKVSLWAGFSTTEPIYEDTDKGLFLRDYITYHPSTIIIRTNKKGMLTEDEESYDSPIYKSGIYQLQYGNWSHQYDQKLPLWKIAHIMFDKQFNNYYGSSLVERCYRWHILKEAYIDMMTTSLDKYGHPTVLYTVPNISTGVERTNPITGEVVTYTIEQILREQITNSDMGVDSSTLILPFIEDADRAKAQVLTGNSNLGSTFIDAIKFCEGQILRNLMIPFNLLEQSQATKDSFAERQIEIFNRVITSLYRTLVVPFINQTIHRQVLYNFNRESAKIPPKLPLRKATRPEARVALMQMIKGLTESGYLNPTNEADWNSTREMVDALSRNMETEDLEFIKKVVINPKQKPTSTKATPRGKEGRPTGAVNPQQKGRNLTGEDRG